jgi:hypothetical protein
MSRLFTSQFENRYLVLFIFQSFVSVTTYMNTVQGDESEMRRSGSPLAKLLADPGVAEELELVDQQIQDLQNVLARFREAHNEHHSARLMQALSGVHANSNFDDSPEPGFQRYEDEISKILLPHQFSRLRQLQIQKIIQLSYDSKFGASRLARLLNLTDEQKQNIEKQSAQFDEEMRNELDEALKRMRVLRETHREKILSEFSVEQVRKYEKLVGPEFLGPSTITSWLMRNAKRIMPARQPGQSPQ